MILLGLPVLLLTLGSTPKSTTDAPSAPHSADDPVESDRILFGQVSCDATDAPLREVLEQIMAGGAKLVVDEEALREKGISLDQKVSLHVERVTRRSALNLVLKPLKLEHSLQKGAIRITAAGEPAGRPLVNRRYYIRDLTSSRWSHAYPENALHSLIELIKSTVEPSTWDTVSFVQPSSETEQGVSIAKSDDGNELLIRQSEEAHRQIHQLLKQLRSNYQVVDREQGEARIHLVRKRASWRFVATPLGEVLKQVSDTYDVNIHLDEQTLRVAKLERSTPITWQASEAKLEDALPLMLGPLGMDYVIQDEVIKIVNDGYGIPVVTMVYGVSDLVNLTRRAAGERTATDFQPLIDQIKSDVSPGSWGEYASMSAFHDNLSLVISHNEAGHRAVAKYLARLRAANLGAGNSRTE